MTATVRAYVNSINDKRIAKALSDVLDRILPTNSDTALTANAGGGQTSALPLKSNSRYHDVTTVATAADSVALPAAKVGEVHFVMNSAAANSMQVFGSGTDTIDSVATATGVPQPAGTGALYVCVVGGNYIRITGVPDSVLAALGGITAGTAAASKAVVLDASKNITGLGSVLSTAPTGGGIGYATGAGGAVTQLTNRTTGVTLSKLAGQITTNNASLAAEAAAEFTVTNTTVAIGDVVVVSQQSGSNGGDTDVYVSAVAAGSFNIKVANNNAAAGPAETGAIIINFAVIKSVAA